MSKFTKCCPEGRAHCAKPDLVPAGDRGRLSKCKDGTSYCVPDQILSRFGKYTPKKCKSTGNEEGRCISICVPEVASQKDLLPRADCEADERCVPCYDPRTDKDTGACSQGYCDPGPSQPPPNQRAQCKDFDPTFDLSKFRPVAPKAKRIAQSPSLCPIRIVSNYPNARMVRVIVFPIRS